MGLVEWPPSDGIVRCRSCDFEVDKYEGGVFEET